MYELLNLLKQTSIEANETTKPVAIMFGQVISSNPLKIKIDQKLTLTESFLILTKSVIDYSVNMTVNHSTESYTHSHGYMDDSSSRTTDSNTHSHDYIGTKKYTIHNKLQVDDNVLLLRIQGGKKFIVLDVIGGGTL